eukprot:1813631-Amphidinium_carterae.1
MPRSGVWPSRKCFGNHDGAHSSSREAHMPRVWSQFGFGFSQWILSIALNVSASNDALSASMFSLSCGIVVAPMMTAPVSSSERTHHENMVQTNKCLKFHSCCHNSATLSAAR